MGFFRGNVSEAEYKQVNREAQERAQADMSPRSYEGGEKTLSYADWKSNGGAGGWSKGNRKGSDKDWPEYVQEVHGMSPEEFESQSQTFKDRAYRGELVGSEALKNPETYFEESDLSKTFYVYDGGRYMGAIGGTPQENAQHAAAEVSQADADVSKLFDREVLNPLLEGAGGNELVQSAKQNALTRSARTVQDTNRTLSRRGTQLTPAQRMAINNQLGLNNATNTTNSVNKAVVNQQDTNNKELNSLFELTSRERFANSKTINQLAGVSAERAADNAAANSAYKNQRFNNTVSGAMSGYSMANGG